MIGDKKFDLSIPLTFTSIKEAKSIFEHHYYMFISNRATQLESGPEHFAAAAAASLGFCVTLISSFSLALQAFIDSKRASFTQKEDIAAAVLQLHLLYTYVSLYTENAPLESRPRLDTFMPQFKEMIVLGEKIISSTSPENHEGQTTSFCLDMGIVIPLYTLAIQCRDPIIRRKAITLLRSTSRQEGLWNSLLAARVAQRVMELEEGRSSELKACTRLAEHAEHSTSL
jgi:hypothetical protein